MATIDTLSMQLHRLVRMFDSVDLEFEPGTVIRFQVGSDLSAGGYEISGAKTSYRVSAVLGIDRLWHISHPALFGNVSRYNTVDFIKNVLTHKKVHSIELATGWTEIQS